MIISKISVFDPEYDNHFFISSVDDFNQDTLVCLCKDWLKDSYAPVFYNLIEHLSPSSCYSSIQCNELVTNEIERIPPDELKRISEAYPSYFNDYLELNKNKCGEYSDSIVFLFGLLDFIVNKEIIPFKTYLKNTGKFAIFEQHDTTYDKHIRIK